MKKMLLKIIIVLLWISQFSLPIFPQTAYKYGLIGLYPFERNLDDISGNEFHGSSIDIDYNYDRYNNDSYALMLNSKRLIQLQNLNIRPEHFSEITFAIWVRPFIADRRMKIVSIDSAGYGRALVIDSTKEGWGYCVFAGDSGVVGRVPIDLKTWTFIAVTYSKKLNVINLFVKNAKKNYRQTLKCGAMPEGYKSVYLGGDPYNTKVGFDGDLDDAIFYSRLLSEFEINCLYDGCPSICELQLPSSPKSLSGSLDLNKLCKGDEVILKIDPIKCAEKIVWEITDQIKRVTEGNEYELKVKFSEEIEKGEIKVYGKNSRGKSSVPISKIFQVEDKPKWSEETPVIKGNNEIIPGGTEEYSLSANLLHKGIYKWVLPNEIEKYLFSQNNDKVILTFNKKYRTGILKVYGENNCGKTGELELVINSISKAPEKNIKPKEVVETPKRKNNYPDSKNKDKYPDQNPPGTKEQIKKEGQCLSDGEVSIKFLSFALDLRTIQNNWHFISNANFPFIWEKWIENLTYTEKRNIIKGTCKLTGESGWTSGELKIEGEIAENCKSIKYFKIELNGLCDEGYEHKKEVNLKLLVHEIPEKNIEKNSLVYGIWNNENDPKVEFITDVYYHEKKYYKNELSEEIEGSSVFDNKSTSFQLGLNLKGTLRQIKEEKKIVKTEGMRKCLFETQKLFGIDVKFRIVGNGEKTADGNTEVAPISWFDEGVGSYNKPTSSNGMSDKITVSCIENTFSCSYKTVQGLYNGGIFTVEGSFSKSIDMLEYCKISFDGKTESPDEQRKLKYIMVVKNIPTKRTAAGTLKNAQYIAETVEFGKNTLKFIESVDYYEENSLGSSKMKLNNPQELLENCFFRLIISFTNMR